MIEAGPLHEALVEGFADMPQQVQVAARFLLDHPGEVALLSMRELAKRAGVPPVTMTRLAQRLGFEGYGEIRTRYADSVRRGTDGFSERADSLVRQHRSKGEEAFAGDLFATVARQVEDLRAEPVLACVLQAAKLLAGARRMFVLGRRSSYPVAYQLAYACGLVGCDARLVDAPGGVGPDQLHDAGADDALVVVSIRPYAQDSVRLARHAAGKGVRVVAVTDSKVSPIIEVATVAVLVGVESPSFFHTMVPAFAAAEALTALVAVAKGETAQAALADREREFEALEEMLALPRSPRASR